MDTTNTTPRITLTSQEFINAWNGGYKGVKEEDGKGYWEGYQLIFENIEVLEKIEIKGFKELPYINLSNSILGDLTIEDSKVKRLVISNNSKIKDFMIFGSATGDLYIRNTEIKGLYIANSDIGDLTLGEFAITSYLGISNDTTLGRCWINNATIKEKFYIQESKLYSITIDAKELRRAEIESSYLENFYWSQNSLCILTIIHSQIEFLLFSHTNLPKDSVLQVANTSVNHFKISLFVNLSSITISGLKPLSNYQKFIEYKDVVRRDSDSKYCFEQITNEKATLHFENSDLGKTSFVNCDLAAFDEFIFYNTKMLEVFVAGTELPKKIIVPRKQSGKVILIESPKKTTLPKDKKDDEKHAQERLAYGQFKKISENRGDNVQATEFLALEMDAYAKHISNDSTKWGEQFNLWLNKISSNWGNDWVQAVRMTLLITAICYVIYCHALGFRMFGTDFNLFLDLASYSFEFLNPLRKADFLKDFDSQIKINWLARTIDYLSRIIIAYFTFQSIQAFRRFGRKS